MKCGKSKRCGWPAKQRPALDELKRLARQAASKGYVRFVGDDVRSNKK